MQLRKKAFAGSLESSDVFVEVGPGEGGITISVDSPVLPQFGDAIRQAVDDELRRLGVVAAVVVLKDRGALECTIRARVETATKRAAEA